MKLVTAAIILLGILLVGSNAWWAYSALDRGVTATYTEVDLEDNRQALDQILTILPMIVEQRDSREEILEQLRNEFGSDQGFEKDGVYWVGKIGLKFDEKGKLYDARRAWD